jgi:oligosaccharide repeat unit polymerase
LLSFTIILTYYAYLFFQTQKRQNRQSISISNNYSVLPIVRGLYYATLPFALYMQIVIVMAKSSLSYTGGYLVNVDVPTVVRMANYIFSAVTMVYLAIKPSKREVSFVLCTFFIVEGGVQLFQGRRALFATTLLFTVWYLIKYYDIVKIRKKYWIIGGVSLFIVVLLFFFVEQQRSVDQASVSSIIDIIEDLMISTGGSDSVIANTIVRIDDFPVSGILCLINPIVNNPITNILTGKMGINQGYDYIESFDSFSHELSYITESSLYLSGYGMGSCYMAEVYLAFGLIGVCVVSILLGKVISSLENICLADNVFVNAACFILVKSLFALPRSELFSWVSDMVYLLFVFILIYPFYRKRKINQFANNMQKND